MSSDFEFAALQHARNYRHAIVQEFAPHLRGAVLEIGAGIGQVSAELLRLPHVASLTALEPDEQFARSIQASLPKATLFRGTMADLPTSETFDSLLSVNVLEHIEDDAAELSRWREHLRPGGALCLFVPARPELYSRIDRAFGHFRRYTRPGLDRKLRDAGFEPDQLHYFNASGYFAWAVLFKWLGRTHFSERGVKFNDRVIFPPTHWIEAHLCRPPFGQSLLAVAHRAPSP